MGENHAFIVSDGLQEKSSKLWLKWDPSVRDWIMLNGGKISRDVNCNGILLNPAQDRLCDRMTRRSEMVYTKKAAFLGQPTLSRREHLVTNLTSRASPTSTNLPLHFRIPPA